MKSKRYYVHQEGNDTAEAVSRRPLTAKPVFVPRASNEGCGVDEVVMEQVLLRVFWPSPVIIIPPLLYYVSCGGLTTGPFAATVPQGHNLAPL
jgi:hypothetical protein